MLPDEQKKLEELPDNVIDLDYIACFDVPYYEEYQMKILPILDTLKKYTNTIPTKYIHPLLELLDLWG